MENAKENYERITGIDFGASTTVVKTKMYDPQGEPVGQKLFNQPLTFNNGASMVPTVVRKKDDNYAFGYDAEVPARGSEPLRSFKLDLESEDPEKAEQAKELTRLFFKYLRNVFEHQLNTGCLGDVNSDNSTIVSYPVKWSGSTREFMISCAREAGFENVTGMDEAEAAIRSVTVQCSEMLKKSGYIIDGEPNNIMLIDMGAGTTDIVICKYTSGKNTSEENTSGENFSNKILTTWPKSGDVLFGGGEIDKLLKEYVVSKFPENLRDSVSKSLNIDKVKAWKENNVSPAMRNGGCVREFSEADFIAHFSGVTLEDFNLDKELFENMFSQQIMQFTGLVGEAIMDSGLAPGDIDFIILTGGHSRWYFVDDILSCATDKFGNLNLAKIKSDPSRRILKVALPQETVAMGMVYSKMSGTTIIFDLGEHLWKQYLETGDRKTLMEALDKENPNAMNEYGSILIKECPEKLDEAIELFEKASQKNLPLASFNLGGCYLRKKRFNEAFNEFEKAAEKLVPEAINELGVCYMEGIGVDVDYDKALECFNKAFELCSYIEAKKNYNDLYKRIHGKPSPFDDSDVDDVVEVVRRTLGSKNIDYFYTVKDNIPILKVAKFMGYFGDTNVLSEKIICYADNSFFDNGKCGFLMTDKKLYTRSVFGVQYVVDVYGIKDFLIVDDIIRFTHIDGRVFKMPCLNLNSRPTIVAVLNNVLDFLKNH